MPQWSPPRFPDLCRCFAASRSCSHPARRLSPFCEAHCTRPCALQQTQEAAHSACVTQPEVSGSLAGQSEAGRRPVRPRSCPQHHAGAVCITARTHTASAPRHMYDQATYACRSTGLRLQPHTARRRPGVRRRQLARRMGAHVGRSAMQTAERRRRCLLPHLSSLCVCCVCCPAWMFQISPIAAELPTSLLWATMSSILTTHRSCIDSTCPRRAARDSGHNTDTHWQRLGIPRMRASASVS